MSEHSLHALRRRWLACLAALALVLLAGVALLVEAGERYETTAEILVAVAAGMLLALLIAIVLDRLDRRVREPTEIEAALGVSVLGELPAANAGAAEARAAACADLVARLEVETATPNPLLMVTACGRRAAAGDVAAGLARHFAELGRRVLLIHADLRSAAPAGAPPGLTTLLSGDGTLSEMLSQMHIVPRSPGNDLDSVVSYSVLATGPAVRNPGAVLGRPALNRVLMSARSPFDVVLVDSGGVVPVSDTAPLARLCDSILLVVERPRPSRRDIEEARRVLGALYGKVVGVAVQTAARPPRRQGASARAGDAPVAPPTPVRW